MLLILIIPLSMAAVTESLERSLQNCSLNNTHRKGEESSGGSSSSSSSSSSSPPGNNDHSQSSETSLELNPHLSLPYHWEQCLDLRTGVVYYINWREGMEAEEDPRTNNNGDLDADYEQEENSYDREESSSGSSSSPPSPSSPGGEYGGDHDVLVVGGCKNCLMYFMVPKQVEDCPKCNGRLLHFDGSETSSSP